MKRKIGEEKINKNLKPEKERQWISDLLTQENPSLACIEKLTGYSRICSKVVELSLELVVKRPKMWKTFIYYHILRNKKRKKEDRKGKKAKSGRERRKGRKVRKEERKERAKKKEGKEGMKKGKKGK